MTDAGAGTAGAGASRMADGPAIPLDHSPRAKRPAAPKLRGRTIAVLEALPRRPSIAALRDVKYEGLQALMRANDIPRRTYGGVPDLLAAVLSWMSANPDAELCLPRELSRRTARRDGCASTPPRAAPGAGAPPEHPFGPPFPGHSPPPERSPREHSAGPRGDSVPGVQHAATMLQRSASEVLTTLDAVAELVARSQATGTLDPAALLALAPQLQSSRSKLQGVVAGFAAADLCASLAAARASPPPDRSRSYADAARRGVDESTGGNPLPGHGPVNRQQPAASSQQPAASNWDPA